MSDEADLAKKKEDVLSQSAGIESRVLNKISVALGFLLFIIGIALIIAENVRIHIDPIFQSLCLSAGLGLIFFGIGDTATVRSRSFTLVGASAITVAIFFVVNHSLQVEEAGRLAQAKEHMHIGRVRVGWHSPTATIAALKGHGSSVPQQMTLSFGGEDIVGKRVSENGVDDFDFPFDNANVWRLVESLCPELKISFQDKTDKTIVFEKSTMIPADFDRLFFLTYIIDDNQLSFYKYEIGRDTPLSLNCDSKKTADVKTAKQTADVERSTVADSPNSHSPPPSTETSPRIKIPNEVRPAETSNGKGLSSVSPAKPESKSPPLRAPNRPAPESQAGSPSGAAQVTETKPSSGLVGYVIFSVIDPKSNKNTKTWFEIVGRQDAQFPAPNDTLLNSEHSNIALRPVPFHWEFDKQSSTPSQSLKTIMNIQLGQKLKVGGDIFIATDQQNKKQYAIAPIASVEGEKLPENVERYPAIGNSTGILGYVYNGYIDPETNRYAERTFDNQTRSTAAYPSPNDILCAKSNVWLRGAPHHWDHASHSYLTGDKLKPIKPGQCVKVAGDTVLAKGGLSIWSPISEIYENGLSDIANKGHDD
jgi:hypothetical protein